MFTSLDTKWWPKVVLEDSPNWTSSVYIQGYHRFHVRQRSEPVDLPLLLSETWYNWSLAADEADVHIARHEKMSHCFRTRTGQLS